MMGADGDSQGIQSEEYVDTEGSNETRGMIPLILRALCSHPGLLLYCSFYACRFER
jgi:hypothetical protein